MIRAHFTLPSLYLAQEKTVDRLNIPFLVIAARLNTKTVRQKLRDTQGESAAP